MKKAKVFYHPIDGSASLTISWSSGPKGDVVESRSGAGVGFFSDKGDLLCVIFDEVVSEQDHQTLLFDRYQVAINVKDGQVTFAVEDLNAKRLLQVTSSSGGAKSRSARKSPKTAQPRKRSRRKPNL